MPWADFVDVAGISLGITLAVGGLGVLGVLALRRRSLIAQVWVIVLVAVLSVVASMIAVAGMMYISSHDLGVAIAVAAVSGIVCLGVATALGSVVVRNSRALTAAAKQIGAGEVVAPGGRQASSEFRALADELVVTSQRLAESRARESQIEASRRQLVAWISHDLRTPLAGIRAMAEALEDGLAADPPRFHRRMREQVDQLSGMVDDLFEFSKIDSATLRLSLQEVSLYDVVSDSVADLRAISVDRDIRVEAPLGHQLVVTADPRELSRAVKNLLMNAIQHTPPGSAVTVRAELTDGRPSVSVIDSGGGIAEEDLPRVFEPGWRGSAARTPDRQDGHSSGAGLGLAIVRGILIAHRGEATVCNVPGGARFDLLLPRDAAVTG